MWDLPGPGIEPVSPALAGGFLTPAPPGKSPNSEVLTLNFYFRRPVEEEKIIELNTKRSVCLTAFFTFNKNS